MADSNKVPFNDEISETGGRLTSVWERFFRKIQDIVDYLQDEGSFSLSNNQAVAAAITPLTFDFRYESQAIIEYVVQRCSSSAEALESGRIVAAYSPKSNSWSVNKTADLTVGAPGFAVTISSDGQVAYTTTNQAGTITYSRINFRVRKIKAKSSLYSVLGG